MKKNLLFIFVLSIVLSAQAQTSKVQQPGAETQALEVFPNPASDYIQLSEEKGVETISVYNLVGRCMKTFNVSKGSAYRIADLPVGMYLVQFVGEKKKIIRTQRLSKR